MKTLSSEVYSRCFENCVKVREVSFFFQFVGYVPVYEFIGTYFNKYLNASFYLVRSSSGKPLVVSLDDAVNREIQLVGNNLKRYADKQ